MDEEVILVTLNYRLVFNSCGCDSMLRFERARRTGPATFQQRNNPSSVSRTIMVTVNHIHKEKIEKYIFDLVTGLITYQKSLSLKFI